MEWVCFWLTHPGRLTFGWSCLAKNRRMFSKEMCRDHGYTFGRYTARRSGQGDSSMAILVV